MKEKTLLAQRWEWRGSILWKALPTLALFWALLWSPSETLAQDTNTVTDGVTTEVVQKEKKWIDVHWMLRWWSNVTPMLGSVLSNKPSLMISVSATHPQTWLWACITRMDDFDKSLESPASQLTMFDIYWAKTLWKTSFNLFWEYATIDKSTESNSFTPIAGLTYDAWQWWTLDSRFCHTFQKWEDSDIIRVWLTKKLNKSLDLAMQWFYRSDLAKKFYGRVIVNVDLGKWFGVQLSCIAKDWKLTPTTWVMFKF